MFFVMLLFAILLIFHFADFNKHRGAIENAFEQATGFELKINGDIKAEIFPYFAASLADIEVLLKFNEDNYSLKSEQLKFVLNTASLMSGDYKFEKIALQKFALMNVKQKEPIFKADAFKSELSATQDYAKFKNITLKHSTGDYHGSIRFIFFPTYNEVDGAFTSDKILFKSKQPKKQDHKIPNVPMQFAGLKGFKGDVEVKAKQVNLDNMRIDDAVLKIDLKDNDFIAKLDSKAFDGSMKASLHASQLKSNNGSKKLDVAIKGANASKLLKHFNPELKIEQGNADFEFKGQGSGQTVPEYLGRLNGSGYIYFKDIRILEKSAKSLYLSDAIFSSLSKHNQEKLECFVTKFNLANGILSANQSIGLETKYIVGLGTGTINLNTETLDILLNMEPLKQSPIEIGDFQGVVTVKGTLTKPMVSVSPSVGREATSVILGIATGGLSLLGEAMINMQKGEVRPCEKILRTN